MSTDDEVKRKVLAGAGRIDALSAMGMNRHERRALAKINKRKKIPGTMKPYVRARKEDEKAGL